MTVCVGATCDDGAAVVLAADRMVTFGPPMMLNTEPEAFNKIQPLGDSAVALFAGAVPEAEGVLSGARSLLVESGAHVVQTVAEAVKGAYAALKRRRAEENILEPMLGTDFEGFQQMITHASSGLLLQQVLGLLQNHDLGLQVMVAGMDGSGGGQLFLVAHPGQLLPVGPTGYAAIGTGGVHAAVRMSLAHHTPKATLVETVYNVYEAKRASEVSPGVGVLTDMAILKDQRVHHVSEATLEVLAGFHKERPTLSDEETETLTEVCDEILA